MIKTCFNNALTCIKNDQMWDINTINDKLLASGYRMDRGYGVLRCKAFRIANMGNIYFDDLNEYLQIIDSLLPEIK